IDATLVHRVVANQSPLLFIESSSCNLEHDLCKWKANPYNQNEAQQHRRNSTEKTKSKEENIPGVASIP
ncbi:hypothetical protein M8C21_004360, partial [Ambrosia artemisiifolia]